jgi:hypothetical protein
MNVTKEQNVIKEHFRIQKLRTRYDLYCFLKDDSHNTTFA